MIVSAKYYKFPAVNLMKNLSVSDPIVIDTGLQAIGLKWNHDGSILAVCGISNSLSEKDSNHVAFYSPLGNVGCSIDS
jgi:WD repeat-containing protein 35